MTQGSNELHFFYDAQNRPAVVVYNGVPYAYVKSLQGDIVAILDENGNAVVSYGYDAWGAPLWCTGELAETLGKVQPFRYRGYVFDEETGLYYLRSRYYNPWWGRFVNADDVGYLHEGMFSNNLFAYCANSPVAHSDPDGDLFGLTITIPQIVTAIFTNPVAALAAVVAIVAIAALAYAGVVLVDHTIRAYRKYKSEEAFFNRAFKNGVVVTATTEVSEFAKDETHKKPQYWLAVIKNGQIVVGQPLTFTEAVNMAYTGYDIIAANQDAAKLIAQTHRICIKDEKHVDDGKSAAHYLPHYHFCRSASCGHIFFIEGGVII